MRRLLASLVLLVPLIAAGQTVGVAGPDAVDVALLNGNAAGPWPGAEAAQSFADLQSAPSSDGAAQYRLGSHWRAQVGPAGPASWPGAFAACGPLNGSGALHAACDANAVAPPRMVGSEVGASFAGNGYSLGMGVSSSKSDAASSPLLPRIVPNSPLSQPAGLPLSALDHTDNINASGRVALGSRTGIDLGASVGRIRLLPGNLLGIDTLGQKSLSVGVDSGPLSGRIVGRIVQPESGEAGALGADHRWTTVDLGVTWRLPWRGELSFGAQNLWSSGQAPQPKAGPETDQSRIPYVQYHQDL